MRISWTGHIYLTVNTLLKQNEIEGQLIIYIAPFYERT